MRFSGESVRPLDIISLLLYVAKGSTVAATMVKFVVVNQPSSYNAIFSRLFMVTTKVCVSLYHMKMKILVEDIVITVRGDQIMTRNCYVATFKENLQVKAANNAQKRNAISNVKNNVQATKHIEQGVLEDPRVTDTN